MQRRDLLGGPDAATARATVAVFAGDPADSVQRQAAQLAAQLGLSLVQSENPAFEMLLTVTAERLELRFPQPGGPGPMVVDFVEGRHGYARCIHRFRLLFKAVGFRRGPLTVLDATAGLGRAAFCLAYHGCRVTAIERSPILYALLRDGLDRADRVPEIKEHLEGRLRVLCDDTREYLQRLALEDAPDVVYLDPMFPEKKKSALVKVEMRILRRLIGDDLDAAELFNLACAVARQRVVVKRSREAVPLAPHPSHSHSDGTTRYDVYLRPQHFSSPA
ncbi:MAG TPA: class I SAM-dependent methyltransferase [Phycisphaerae bacterium]|nr:class I SAM-dependent methyltransferase [Phycisphaerae bacterium]